jgi:outer membrane protein OmpA-like peptidoglycan-associated protein
MTTILLNGVIYSTIAQSDTSVKVYSKFDFIPGEKVVFFDDFDENIGDFPSLWNTNGSGEIVTTDIAPGKWFQFTGSGFFIPDTKGDFPENFTAEFDFIPTNKQEDIQGIGFGFYIVSGDIKNPSEGGAIPGKSGMKLNIDGYTSYYDSYTDGEYRLNGNYDYQITKNKVYRLSVWVQKQRMRMYINDKKIFDIPRGMPEGVKYNMLRFELGDESKPMIANFRVATGLPDMRNKLITEGKLVSYGVYFDINKATVKPESFGTLKEIAQVLKDNPAVKVKIVGHTDSDGDNATNLDLSKRRAVSVKNELTNNFGIDANRLETDGMGETQPITTNDSPSNKAKNRRVEFIKL